MDNKQIYQVWLDAWNIDLSLLKNITDPECTVHQARIDEQDSKELKGVAALKEIITSGTHFFENGHMSLSVGPIVDQDYVSARWTYTGNYTGGLPGAKADIGKEISFSGIDIFRIKKHKIREYWVSSDGIHFMQQLDFF